jgi:hypothetical protein
VAEQNERNDRNHNQLSVSNPKHRQALMRRWLQRKQGSGESEQVARLGTGSNQLQEAAT